MYVVREVFRTKPGKAKELVAIFKKAFPYFEKEEGFISSRVMTDVVGNYWTVVIESEVSDLGPFFANMGNRRGSDELKEAMKGYMDLLEGGKREIYKIE